MAKFARSPIIQAPDLASALGQQTAFNKEVQQALSGNLTLKENAFAELITQEVTGPEPVRHYVGGSGEPPFLNGWVNYTVDTTWQGAGFYMSPDGRVALGGLVVTPAGAVGANTDIFLLPVGYRPVRHEMFITRQQLSPYVATHQVLSDGRVQSIGAGGGSPLALGNWVSISGIGFQASGSPAPITAPPATPIAEYLGVQTGTAGLTHVNRTNWPVKITLKRIKKPLAVLLAQVQDISTGNSGNSGVVTHATAPDWLQTADNKIDIRSVGGLLPGRKYKITFLVLG